MRTTIITLVAMFAVLTMARATETVIKDNFDTQQDGPALNSRPIESSSVVWEATPNLVVSKEGAVQVTNNKNNEPFLAKVQLPPGKGVVVTAEVTPQCGNEDKGAWYGIGMGAFKRVYAGAGITWEGGLFCIVHANGAFECYAAPSGKPLVKIDAKHKAPVSPGQTTKLSFHYQSADNLLTVWVNDFTVIEDASLGDFHPSMEQAGFSAVNPKADVPAVDNFSVEVSA